MPSTYRHVMFFGSSDYAQWVIGKGQMGTFLMGLQIKRLLIARYYINLLHSQERQVLIGWWG